MCPSGIQLTEREEALQSCSNNHTGKKLFSQPQGGALTRVLTVSECEKKGILKLTLSGTRMHTTQTARGMFHEIFTFCLENPGSTTYTIPSMVNDVSAIFVDTTIFRPGGPPGVRGGGASCQNRPQN